MHDLGSSWAPILHYENYESEARRPVIGQAAPQSDCLLGVEVGRAVVRRCRYFYAALRLGFAQDPADLHHGSDT